MAVVVAGTRPVQALEGLEETLDLFRWDRRPVFATNTKASSLRVPVVISICPPGVL
ncbi:MAG TPA: hypothetical protein VEF89_18270 [Solirubrobacteraceae bacterium]|nr:hypothetical protein [Solirubrobacteraceae bacterium]